MLRVSAWNYNNLDKNNSHWIAEANFEIANFFTDVNRPEFCRLIQPYFTRSYIFQGYSGLDDEQELEKKLMTSNKLMKELQCKLM